MADSSARLTILNGPLAGRELVLEEVVDNILIGSDGACRFHLPVPGISPIHARIWMDAAGVTIYDTHSPRGLYVNDDRVNGQAPLHNGDVLWLGTPGEDEAVMIQVRLPPRAGATAEPPVPVAAPPAPEVVEETDSTVVMSAGAPLSPPPPTEVLEVVDEVEEESGTVAMRAPSLDAFAIADPEPAPPEESAAEATMVMAAPEDVPVLAEPESDATVVGYEPPAAAEPESDATIVGYEPQVVVEPTEAFRIAEPGPGEGEEPVKFSLDLAPPPAPEPPAFEDETTADMAAAPPEPPTYVPPPPPEPPPPPPPPPPVAAAPPPAPARTPRPAPPATPPPAPRRAAAGGGSSGALYAALGGLAFVVLAGGGYAAWRMMQGAPSGAAATPPPVTVADAAPSAVEAAPATLAPEAPTTLAPEPVPEPPIEEAVTIVQSPPPKAAGTAPTPRPGTTAPPKAGATPPPTTLSAEVARAQQAAAQVGTLLGKADTQAAARDFAAAAATYDEVLKLEPGNPKAGEGKAAALAAVASLKKTFVPGRTSVQSGKAAKGGISGFDSEDVSVAKAPDYSGRIDFEFSPRNVKAGDNFTILVYLTNDGKKDFKIASVSATTAVNGSRSTTPVSAPSKELSSQQRVLLSEIPGTWAAGTTSWSLDVTVTSNRNDSFRSQLAWK